METSIFDFSLPSDLIAQFPTKKREKSRLLFYDRFSNKIEHKKFFEITKIFGKNDVLVFNRSKVIPARIKFSNNNEVFLAEKISEKIWKCLVRPGKKFLIGQKIIFSDHSFAEVLEILPDGMRKIAFFPQDNMKKFLEKYGQVPLPPYISRKPKKVDQKRYQNIFADSPGSVAAPTAGLHFSKKIFTELEKNGVQFEFIDLQVGPGTFLPVKTDKIEDHKMHTENFEISNQTVKNLNLAKKNNKKITAIGSTSLRVLETNNKNGFFLPQSGKTDIFIFPPAKFRAVDHFLTNFHLPKSTLLMLVAAFISPERKIGIKKILEIYNLAINKKYRFFSFGDATLLW